MAPDPRLDLYANSNSPLPINLQEPLFQTLEQLRRRWGAYEREKLCLVEAIDSRQAMIEALKMEIDTFDSARKHISKREDDLSAQRQRFTATLSSIRRIPPEALASIIQFAIQGPDGATNRQERVVFSHIRSVCLLWRETSLSTPSLWRLESTGVGYGRPLHGGSPT
jgi:hypothetical protein